jgi:hypothetical protein
VTDVSWAESASADGRHQSVIAGWDLALCNMSESAAIVKPIFHFL